MISSIAHRPVYTPHPIRTEAASRSLSQSGVRFGHTHQHVHADGQTCTDKHCTEGKQGERQFCLKPFFDWVKKAWQKVKDFFSNLFGKSKPQEATTTTTSAPTAAIATIVPPVQLATQTSQDHQHQEKGHHNHAADGQCCGSHPSHAHDHHAHSHSH